MTETTKPGTGRAPAPVAALPDGGAAPPAGGLGLLRIHLLRAAFLLMGGGLAAVQWPTLVHHPCWTLSQGVVKSMFVALSVLGLLGVLRPVRMLPVLLFEITWKLVWLAIVALPAWAGGSMDADVREALPQVLLIVVVMAVVPWGHVLRTYLTGPTDPWRSRAGTGGVTG